MTEMKKWENEVIAKQPVFNSKEEAIDYSLKKMKEDQDLPEVFQEPDGGKFVAANYQAFETLMRKGYKRVAGLAELMHAQSDGGKKNVAKTFRDIRNS